MYSVYIYMYGFIVANATVYCVRLCVYCVFEQFVVRYSRRWFCVGGNVQCFARTMKEENRLLCLRKTHQKKRNTNSSALLLFCLLHLFRSFATGRLQCAIQRMQKNECLERFFFLHFLLCSFAPKTIYWVRWVVYSFTSSFSVEKNRRNFGIDRHFSNGVRWQPFDASLWHSTDNVYIYMSIVMCFVCFAHGQWPGVYLYFIRKVVFFLFSSSYCCWCLSHIKHVYIRMHCSAIGELYIRLNIQTTKHQPEFVSIFQRELCLCMCLTWR